MSYYRFDGDDGVGSVEFRRNKFAENSGVQCRVLALLRHAAPYDECQLSGVKRKWLGHRQTDANDPFSDIAGPLPANRLTCP
jgi:hypothetical protein